VLWEFCEGCGSVVKCCRVLWCLVDCYGVLWRCGVVSIMECCGVL